MAENSCDGTQNLTPQTTTLTVKKSFSYATPAYSLVVIRIKGSRNK
jgi:hypothetical protein